MLLIFKMRLIAFAIFFASLICANSYFVLADETLIDYNSDDTVAVEGKKIFLILNIMLQFYLSNFKTKSNYLFAVNSINDAQESGTTVVYDSDDVVNTTPSPSTGRENREEGEEGTYCVTSTGLSGNCESVQQCFPRLFPVNASYDDTPLHTGVYNLNLAKMLIEASGFCGSSISQRSVPFTSM